MTSRNSSNGNIRRSRAAAAFAGVVASVTLATAACGSGGQTSPAAAPAAPKAQQPAIPQTQRTLTIKDLYEQGRHSVFQIVGRVPGGSVTGTGFVVDRGRGMALTNAHVVSDMTAIKAYFPDGGQYSLHVMAQDPCSDLAIVHFADALDANVTQVSLGTAAGLQVGDAVTTLGFPGAAATSAESSPRPTIATGMIQANKAVVTGGDDLPQYVNTIQHNATINPGNSGGPLYDAHGKVVGVNSLSTSSSQAQGLFYSISIDRVKDKLAALEGGNSENDAGWTLKPLSSFTFSDLLPELAMGSSAQGAWVDRAVRTGALKGLVVTGTTPGGSADQGGLQPLDVVQTVQDQPVHSVAEACDVIESVMPGSQVRVSYLRFPGLTRRVSEFTFQGTHQGSGAAPEGGTGHGMEHGPAGKPSPGPDAPMPPGHM